MTECARCGYDHDVIDGAMRDYHTEYAEAVTVFLSLAIGKLAGRSSTMATWENQGEKLRQITGHWVPMTWDFVETNPFLEWDRCVEAIARVVERLPRDCGVGVVFQAAAGGEVYERFLRDTEAELRRLTS